VQLVTSLSFQGQAREAFEFYRSVLGGEITGAYPYGDPPPGVPWGPEHKDWLMHIWLQIGDQALMGADMDAAWAPNIVKPKNGFDVTFHTKDIDEARRVYDGLSAGGVPSPMGPFGETFWSPGYGSFTDRFGVPWMINTIPGEGWTPPKMA
jgi:PhnB protein